MADVFDKRFNNVEEMNSSKYTFYGTRNKRVDSPNQDEPINDYIIREKRETNREDQGLEMRGEAWEVMEQRYLTKDQGFIYGLHDPKKVRFETNELDLGFNLNGLGRYPAFNMGYKVADQKEEETLDGQV